MVLSLTASHSLLETIWADFVLKNPLQVDVELTDLTIVVKEAGKIQTDQPQEELVEVEEIDKISLAPGEQRTVSLFLGSAFPRAGFAYTLNARSRSPSNPFDRRSLYSQNSPTNSSVRSPVRNPSVPVGGGSTIPPSKDRIKLTPRMFSSRSRLKNVDNV